MLGGFWASHGYVVVAPTHADSIRLRRERGEIVNPGELLRRPAGGDPLALSNRTRDVRFLLDSLDALEGKVPNLKRRIDRKALGMSGHSMGAMTAQLLAGVRSVGRGEAADVADPRPAAFLLLSPQGRGTGLSETSWEGVKRPLMVMTGTHDRGRRGQPPEWRIDPFTLSPPGDKYLVFIQDAYHMSFTDRLAGEELRVPPERPLGAPTHTGRGTRRRLSARGRRARPRGAGGGLRRRPFRLPRLVGRLSQEGAQGRRAPALRGPRVAHTGTREAAAPVAARRITS